MKKALIVCCAILLLGMVPCWGQGAGNSCDPSGTWLGGADPAVPYYQMTVTPSAANRYTVVFQLFLGDAASGTNLLQAVGYSAWTNWTGEMTRTGGRTFDIYALSSYVLTPAGAQMNGDVFGFTIDPALPEVDIVRSHEELADCNTLYSTIDVYSAYFNYTYDKIPFVTVPDVDYLGGATIVETYHRMPVTCSFCASTKGVAANAAAPASRKRK